ncbi:MAG: hypothetical protein IRZ08_03405 [Frankia sp.]|nr:hypothetical protein [Frankia sp.]
MTSGGGPAGSAGVGGLVADGAPGAEGRIRWPVVAAFTAGGAAMLGGGVFVDDQYAQSILVNLGTTLLLFAALFLAEQRLLLAFTRVLGPRTLAEAQRDLTDLISSARQVGGGGAVPVTTAAACRDAVNRIGPQLWHAGLRQQPSAHPDRIVYTDEAGLALRWEIAWDAPGLRHEISIGTEHRSWGPWALSGGSLTPADLAILREFENEVFHSLRQIVLRLRGGP